ncbi:cation:proton antiporter [Thermosediminibacter litoriperuensis]|uniref:Transporter (CPA2 family) n=1 Tax=Thermosediminibacter litoriperuensis TaxID=291989 RepID=A0A5S5AZZ9_9FIRM|nr:cation:proton antiporter [Thermosediminibacter litoriperuensis]TYP58835.1 transporter (CPA2 family) [Thermosediminibacter litoriperuensis]
MTLLELAVILGISRIGGYLAARFNQVNVLGQIIAGLLIGPSALGLVHSEHVLEFMAEIGVILLMFLAGLETDTSELIASGLSSTVIAAGGVVLPFAAGVWAGLVGGVTLPEALFLGTMLTATSVSITVQALREMGKLNSKEGIAILAAAVIDDVIGIILLTFIIGYVSGGASILPLMEKIGVFAVSVAVLAFLLHRYGERIIEIMKPGTRLITFALVLCFSVAYFAEKADIAAITGAYIAGLIFSNYDAKEKIVRGVEEMAYLFFTPIFFVSIGLKADVRAMLGGIGFSLLIIAVAVLGKIFGCGLMAKLVGFSWREGFTVGAGMVPRGEVALIIVNLGLKRGIVSQRIFTASVLMVLVTTLVAPPLLKLLFHSAENIEGSEGDVSHGNNP